MKDLSVGNERKNILYFALPMLLGNVFQLLYNVIDRIVVGRAIGTEALGAVGASFPVIFALLSLFIGIAIGFTIVISQYFGAKDIENVRKTIDTLYIMIFVASIIVTVLGLTLSKGIFKLIGLPAEIQPLANTYFQIYMAGSLLTFGFNGISAILRGLGDSKTPLYFLVISTVFNIIFDLLFVVVFKWGVAGAAFATVLSQGGAFVSAILYLNKYHEVINLSWRKLAFDKVIFIKSLKLGTPIGLQQLSVALGMSVMFILVNPFGTAAVAAYTAVFTIGSFVSIPSMNFAAALSTFVGQNMGAGKPYRVKNGLTETLKMLSGFVLLMTVLSVLLRRELIFIFSNDPDVVNIGAGYLAIVSWFYIAFSVMFVIGGVMRGAGDTLVPMFITIIALWLVRIPVCYFLSLKYGVVGIWWGIPVAWIIGMVLSYLYYLTGKWKNKTIAKIKSA